MKLLLPITFTLLCCGSLNLQAQFSDNFDDGTIDGWGGETTAFIANVDGQLQLQGDCDLGGIDYLSAAVATKDSVVWELYVHLDFDPSSSNYARVYLQSDQPDLTGGLHGYFLKLGADGSGDVVELYRQDDLTYVLVASGTTVIATAPVMGIRVVRTNDAEWQIYLDPTGGIAYSLETSATDATYNGGDYFGVFCKYTSTRCDLFYFDNVFIDPLYVDTEAPEIFALNVISPTQLEVDFNETVDLVSSETESNYSVDAGVGNPLNAARDAIDFSKVLLTFVTPFPEATTLTLTVNDVADQNGNAIVAGSATFSYYTVHEYDVVIDEIFADPEPVVALPDAEFVELFNQAPVDLDLAGWVITDGSTESDPFPPYIIPAGGYVIVCDDGNANLFSSYPNVLGVNSFPGLNNDGDYLSLYNDVGVLIHSADYTLDWYDNTIKEDGGWTLEMIDPQNPCSGDDNWTASENENGGTPGIVNSVDGDNMDVTNPSLISAFPLDDDTLILYFDEALELGLLDVSQFNIDNGIGNPVEIITDPSNPLQIGLGFSTAFNPGVIYTVTVNGVQDCSGNTINLFNSAQFGLPEPLDSNDVVINEVLFNPYSEGVDFVELYNRSDKIIDVSDLIIAELDIIDATNILESAFITTTGRLCFPGTYFVVTSSIAQTEADYHTENESSFYETSSMPNYPDQEGVVVLFDATLQIIDQLHYYDDWQFALLSDKSGVSLERLNYDNTTQDEDNWHSAATDAGYATPGYQNSIFGEASAEGDIEFEYNVFSPDGDGYHDVMIIGYTTPSEGYTGNVKIYDVQGRLVKDLVNNELLSRESFFTWDGVSDEGTAAKMGIYILYAEFFNLDGRVETHKLKFTLVRKH